MNHTDPPKKEVALRNSLFVVAALVSLSSVVVLFLDGQIWILISKIAPASPNRTLLFFSKRGLYVFYLVFAALLTYALVRKETPLKNLCIAWLKAEVVFGFALVRVMKILLGRARPPMGSEFDFFSIHNRYNSFPSGHAADAFVSGVFLFYLLRHSKYRFVPLLYAFLMALSRVLVYEHHPSDVIAGAAIGIWGASFMLFRGKPESPRAR